MSGYLSNLTTQEQVLFRMQLSAVAFKARYDTYMGYIKPLETSADVSWIRDAILTCARKPT